MVEWREYLRIHLDRMEHTLNMNASLLLNQLSSKINRKLQSMVY
jgi:hypothetical protein